MKRGSRQNRSNVIPVVLMPAKTRQFLWNVGTFASACWIVIGHSIALHGAAFSPTNTVPISSEAFLERVLHRNEGVQIQLIEQEIARRLAKAEKGIFEPEFVASAERVDNRRQTSSQQFVSLGVPILTERNDIYDAGIEALIASGATIRIGYSLENLRNNLQATRFPPVDQEWQSFSGATLTQPLLKNFGKTATMAGIRLAALSSDVAFQEYRKELMTIVTGAQASYWNLYLAQEQVRLIEQSVETGETVLEDARVDRDTGRGTELEVLEAETGLALRRAALESAMQAWQEALFNAMAYFSSSVMDQPVAIRALPPPEPGDPNLSFFEHWRNIHDLNPDFAIQRTKMIQEDVRIAYARNQSLPQLDLRASYGLNGLGQTPADSWNEIEHGNYPSWSVGIELRIPLSGGRKARQQRSVAELRKEQALLGMKQLETKLHNALDNSLRKIQSSRQGIAAFSKSVDLNQNLLDTEMARFEAGASSIRRTLEIERSLLEARLRFHEHLVQHQQALLELELITGSVLNSRNLDVTRDLLESRTSAMLVRKGRDEEDIAKVLPAALRDYDQNRIDAESPELFKARGVLREGNP